MTREVLFFFAKRLIFLLWKYSTCIKLLDFKSVQYPEKGELLSVLLLVTYLYSFILNVKVYVFLSENCTFMDVLYSEFSGDHRRSETLVPIPNTPVKPSAVDGSAAPLQCESRLLPGS